MKRCLITALGLAAALTMAAPVYAETGGDSVIDTSRTGTLTIDYQDDSTGMNPVEGAEFTLYKIAEFGSFGNYELIVPGISDIYETADSQPDSQSVEQDYICNKNSKKFHNPGCIAVEEMKESNKERVRSTSDALIAQGYSPCEICQNGVLAGSGAKAGSILKTVKNAYSKKFDGSYTVTIRTDKNGKAVASKLPLGLYLAEETKAAKDHLCSEPFLFSTPYTQNNVWVYDVKAFPKALPTSYLKIRKTVTGNAGETNREFHFRVTLGSTEEFEYERNDGVKGKIKSGGTIALKSGQDATVKMIPVGCTYDVSEVEANQGGYKTTITENKGKIEYKKTRVASFVNRKDVEKSKKVTKTPSQGEKVRTGDTIRPILLGAAIVAAVGLLVYGIIKRRESK